MQIVINLDEILQSQTNGKEKDVLNRPIDNGIDINELRYVVDRHYLSRALDLCGNNSEKAARLVNLSPITFRNRLRKAQLWLGENK